MQYHIAMLQLLRLYSCAHSYHIINIIIASYILPCYGNKEVVKLINVQRYIHINKNFN